MQFLSKLGLAFLAGSSIVLASTVPLKERSFNTNGVTFRGEIGGHKFEEVGTVQEVWTKLKARYPEIELKKLDEVKAAELSKRDVYLPPLCIPVNGQDWQFADLSAIEDGISYLNGLDTDLNIDAGWGTCSRISCSYNAAIYWCNDNTYQISVPSSYLADMVGDINNYCKHCIEGRWCVTGGQIFEEGDYNIIVRDENC